MLQMTVGNLGKCGKSCLIQGPSHCVYNLHDTLIIFIEIEEAMSHVSESITFTHQHSTHAKIKTDILQNDVQSGPSPCKEKYSFEGSYKSYYFIARSTFVPNKIYVKDFLSFQLYEGYGSYLTQTIYHADCQLR